MRVNRVQNNYNYKPNFTAVTLKGVRSDDLEHLDNYMEISERNGLDITLSRNVSGQHWNYSVKIAPVGGKGSSSIGTSSFNCSGEPAAGLRSQTLNYAFNNAYNSHKSPFLFG